MKRKIRMNLPKKKLVILVGYMIATGQFAVLYATFLVAYFQPTKSVLVTVDSVGEANAEFIIIPIAFATCILGIYYLMKDIKIKAIKLNRK